MKVKLTLEYDGSFFCGWQRQPDQHSVQQCLEEALDTLLSSQAHKMGLELELTPTLTASGRTDAGVHALAQVASFSWPAALPFDAWKLQGALNGITPAALSILDVASVSDDFDARRSPHIKCYKYYMLHRKQGEGLHSGRVWQFGYDIDLPLMIRSAQLICGTHDFSAFRASDCSSTTSVRSILRSELSRVDSSTLVYSVQGNGFLKQMVRTIVGTLVEIGRGKKTIKQLEALLQGGERTAAGETAPASGLHLAWVRYHERT